MCMYMYKLSMETVLLLIFDCYKYNCTHVLCGPLNGEIIFSDTSLKTFSTNAQAVTGTWGLFSNHSPISYRTVIVSSLPKYTIEKLVDLLFSWNMNQFQFKNGMDWLIMSDTMNRNIFAYRFTWISARKTANREIWDRAIDRKWSYT
jgi:hypothetical protein